MATQNRVVRKPKRGSRAKPMLIIEDSRQLGEDARVERHRQAWTNLFLKFESNQDEDDEEFPLFDPPARGTVTRATSTRRLSKQLWEALAHVEKRDSYEAVACTSGSPSDLGAAKSTHNKVQSWIDDNLQMFRQEAAYTTFSDDDDVEVDLSLDSEVLLLSDDQDEVITSTPEQRKKITSYGCNLRSSVKYVEEEDGASTACSLTNRKGVRDSPDERQGGSLTQDLQGEQYIDITENAPGRELSKVSSTNSVVFGTSEPTSHAIVQVDLSDDDPIHKEQNIPCKVSGNPVVKRHFLDKFNVEYFRGAGLEWKPDVNVLRKKVEDYQLAHGSGESRSAAGPEIMRRNSGMDKSITEVATVIPPGRKIRPISSNSVRMRVKSTSSEEDGSLKETWPSSLPKYPDGGQNFWMVNKNVAEVTTLVSPSKKMRSTLSSTRRMRVVSSSSEDDWSLTRSEMLIPKSPDGGSGWSMCARAQRTNSEAKDTDVKKTNLKVANKIAKQISEKNPVNPSETDAVLEQVSMEKQCQQEHCTSATMTSNETIKKDRDKNPFHKCHMSNMTVTCPLETDIEVVISSPHKKTNDASKPWTTLKETVSCQERTDKVRTIAFEERSKTKGRQTLGNKDGIEEIECTDGQTASRKTSDRDSEIEVISKKTQTNSDLITESVMTSIFILSPKEKEFEQVAERNRHAKVLPKLKPCTESLVSCERSDQLSEAPQRSKVVMAIIPSDSSICSSVSEHRLPTNAKGGANTHADIICKVKDDVLFLQVVHSESTLSSHSGKHRNKSKRVVAMQQSSAADGCSQPSFRRRTRQHSRAPTIDVGSDDESVTLETYSVKHDTALGIADVDDVEVLSSNSNRSPQTHSKQLKQPCQVENCTKSGLLTSSDQPSALERSSRKSLHRISRHFRTRETGIQTSSSSEQLMVHDCLLKDKHRVKSSAKNKVGGKSDGFRVLEYVQQREKMLAECPRQLVINSDGYKKLEEKLEKYFKRKLSCSFEELEFPDVRTRSTMKLSDTLSTNLQQNRATTQESALYHSNDASRRYGDSLNHDEWVSNKLDRFASQQQNVKESVITLLQNNQVATSSYLQNRKTTAFSSHTNASSSSHLGAKKKLSYKKSVSFIPTESSDEDDYIVVPKSNNWKLEKRASLIKRKAQPLMKNSSFSPTKPKLDTNRTFAKAPLGDRSRVRRKVPVSVDSDSDSDSVSNIFVGGGGLNRNNNRKVNVLRNRKQTIESNASKRDDRVKKSRISPRTGFTISTSDSNSSQSLKFLSRGRTGRTSELSVNIRNQRRRTMTFEEEDQSDDSISIFVRKHIPKQ